MRTRVFGEAWAFFVHLRWHYTLLVLSGPYLLGGLYVAYFEPRPFLLQLLVVQLLLNGGVTAYNSYFDDDDGPIGGLSAPPKMSPWMHPASLVLQACALGLGLLEGPVFAGLVALTLALSALYSHPRFRWKGHPIKSLVCVGVGTGTNTFWMGYLAAGSAPLGGMMLLAGLGVASMLLSLYPASQIYQVEEDARRGDRTFASVYGLAGVRRFHRVSFPLGIAVVAFTIHSVEPWIAYAFGAVGAVAFVANDRWLGRLVGDASEYPAVMRLKYGASLGFVALITAALAYRVATQG